MSLLCFYFVPYIDILAKPDAPSQWLVFFAAADEQDLINRTARASKHKGVEVTAEPADLVDNVASGSVSIVLVSA